MAEWNTECLISRNREKYYGLLGYIGEKSRFLPLDIFVLIKGFFDKKMLPIRSLISFTRAHTKYELTYTHIT